MGTAAPVPGGARGEDVLDALTPASTDRPSPQVIQLTEELLRDALEQQNAGAGG